MDLRLNILKNKSLTFKADYLVRLNIPAHSARRDMAYDNAISILCPDLMSLPKEERLSKYERVSSLLNEARETAHIISSCLVKKNYSDPYEQYLILLIDTIKAAASLLNHEIVLQSEKKEMEVFIGGDYASQAKMTDKIFCQSESDIFKNILELVKIANAPINNFRNNCIRKFNEDENERYRKASSEFSILYSSLAGTGDKSDGKSGRSFSEK